MSLLRIFNPYGLDDAVVDALSTGRDGVVADLLHMIDSNIGTRPVQHAIVVAPRGFGKSFLMRLLQNRLRERTNIAVALLPEEQRNVRRAHLLPEEIRRVFQQRPAADVRVRWSEEAAAWGNSVAALDTAIAKTLGPDGLLVVMLENFDHLLATVFREDAPQRLLRGWLTRESGRVMLLATATRPVDDDYAQPLFQAFTDFRLPLWTEDDCLQFYDRVRARDGKPALTDRERARARAVAIFAGGSPRIATVLYEALSSSTALTAAALLDELVDELSDYFRNRIDRLSPRAQDVVDTLLRVGEPKSQTDLAALLGESQSRVAEVFRELQTDQFLRGTPSARTRVTLYQVTDRLLVHFYRTRYFDPEHRLSPLEAIAEFLSDFFDADERQAEVERLRAEGRDREAATLGASPRPNSDSAAVQAPMGLDGGSFLGRRQIDRDWYLSRPSEDGRGALSLCDRLLEALDGSTDLVRAEAILDDLETEVAIRADPVCRALTLHWRGEILLARSGPSARSAAIATLREALARAEAAGDLREQAVTLGHIGWSQGQLGRHEEAIATLREALARAEAAGDVREQAETLRRIGWSQGELGRHEEAIATLREALARAEAAGDVRAQAETLRHVGWNQGELGRHEAAIATLREALARAEAAGDVWEQAETLGQIGWSQGELGRHEEAIATLREALARAEAAGDLLAQAQTLRLIGWSQGQLGRNEEAIATLREAVDRAEAAGDVREQVYALGMLIWRGRLAAVTMQHVPALLHRLLLVARKIKDGRNPAAIYFDDAIALSVRSNEFAETWRVARSANDVLADTVYSAGVAVADEVHRIATADGRAAGYAAAASVVDTLASDATWPAGEGLTAAALLRETVNALARTLTEAALLRDIADLLDARLPNALPTERALTRARVLDLERPDDPAALEGVDPDIAAAIRRLRGETDPEVLFRRNAGRTPAGAAAPKTRGAARKRRGKKGS